MPNWVENLLTIENVSSERLEEIRGKIAGTESKIDKNGRNTVIIQRAIDFQKICPVPAVLEIEDSSLGDKGYEIFCEIMANEKSMDPVKEYNIHCEIMAGEGSMDPNIAANLENKFKDYCNKLQEEDKQKAFRLGMQYYINLSEYSCKTSNDWCYDNWGTKWNSKMSISVSANEIFFLTANNPPLEIIMLLGAEFKDAKFELSYSSESNLAGIFSVHGFKEEMHDYSEDLQDSFDYLRNKLRRMKHKFEQLTNSDY